MLLVRLLRQVVESRKSLDMPGHGALIRIEYY
jgi:hypothetical protein